MAINFSEEAIAAGARRCKACAVLAIDVRMLQRWKKELQEENKLEDQRKVAAAERDTPFATPQPISNNFLPAEASKFTKRGR